MSKTTEQLRAEAKRLYDESKSDEAYQAYNRVIASTDTPSGEDFFNRGMIGIILKRQESIIQDFTESLRLGFEVSQSHLFRAVAYQLFLGDDEKALQDYTAVIELVPLGFALWARGKIYFAKGDFANAIRDFSEAIRNVYSEQDKAKSFFKRAQCYAATKEFEKSLADFSEALNRVEEKSNYSAMECLQLRADVYIQLSQFDKALSDLKALIVGTPTAIPPPQSENQMDVETWESLKLPLLRLKISNSEVLCPKILMKRHLRNVDEWTSSRPELQIDQTVLFRMMTGQPIDFSKIPLLSYYSLFDDLGLSGYMRVVCKVVEELTDLRHVLGMLLSASESRRSPMKSASQLFEEQDDLAGCPFCQSCLNVLKANAETIRQDSVLFRACGRLDVVCRLDEAAVGIQTLPSFSQLGDDAPTSFAALFRTSLRELSLDDPKQLTDVVLCTTDGAEESAHLGPLMCRSKFFSRMMNFDGKEKSDFFESGKIHLEKMSHSDLLELLHWIYRDEVDKSATLQSCLRLLQFAAMHLEPEMTTAFRLAVLDRIQETPRVDLVPVLVETAETVLDLPREPIDLSLVVKVAFAARLDLGAEGLEVIGSILKVGGKVCDLSNELSTVMREQKREVDG